MVELKMYLQKWGWKKRLCWMKLTKGLENIFLLNPKGLRRNKYIGKIIGENKN
jgi:hypothetical protein